MPGATGAAARGRGGVTSAARGVTRPAVARFTVTWIAACCVAAAARADRVELADGRVLEGRFALVSGVDSKPLEEGQEDRQRGEPVVVCDDELTRTMVAKRQVVKTERGGFDLGVERLRIPQRVPDRGRRVAGVGVIVDATRFDDFGRRILTLSTAGGRIDVVQGITEISPRWTRVEGLLTEKPLMLDMRLATSSLPYETLRRVVRQHVDRTDPEQRLRIVRLLLQAERYEDAGAELDAVLADFPDLANLARERRTITRLAAGRLLDEIQRRSRCGQDTLALELLESFPTADADGELLEAVREARDDLRQKRDRVGRLTAALKERLARLEADDVRAEAGAAVAEITRDLSTVTLPRLATCERIGLDAAVPADRTLALAISGWLLGPTAAGDNLKTALSAGRLRDLLREHLRTPDPAAREPLLGRMRAEEAFDPATLAALAAQMRPPLDPPEPISPGLHELTVPAADGAESVRCLVQLPPEYDPLRRHPAVVTLHAAWNTPLNQIEWWAGQPNAAGQRQGQAGRQGTIVIAPAWTRPGQPAYEYGAREHAAVLASLREAGRRFAIDTDRVFLSGHSLGGDAAWDIALAHPDLWAGLVAIAPGAGRYVTHYWPNARSLPVYVVGGELDGGLKKNVTDLDRYFFKGFDVTYVEYRGRGHEHFGEEIQRIFDWMGRKQRTFFPRSIEAVTLRPWDRFFWWIELEGAPPRTVVPPAQWPPPPGTRPFGLDGKLTGPNTIVAHCGADRTRIWLAPELVDFARPVSVTLDGQKLHRGPIAADVGVLLDDLRLRGDRQHPFWAVIESTRRKEPEGGGRGRPPAEGRRP